MIKTTAINKVVLEFFHKNPNVHIIAAHELMPQMIKAGIYPNNRDDALYLRNDFRDLQRSKELHLIHSLVGVRKKKYTNWFFQRIVAGKVKRPEKEWSAYCTKKLNLLCDKKPESFFKISAKLPVEGGIYLITVAPVKGLEEPLYIGRTVNLKRRIYTNHLMGPLSNARLKKYVMAHFKWKEVNKEHRKLAKDYILGNCQVRWITDEEIQKGNPFPKEEKHRVRGALEGYFTGVLFPKFGIYKEH